MGKARERGTRPGCLRYSVDSALNRGLLAMLNVEDSSAVAYSLSDGIVGQVS